MAASFTVSNGQTDTTAKTVNGADAGTVEAGSTLQTSGAAITFNNTSSGAGVSLNISGSVISTGGRAFDSSGGTTTPRNLTFTVTDTGLVRSDTSDAFRINTNVSGGTITINNAGTILAATTTDGSGQALDLRTMNNAGGTLIVNNTGTIRANADDALRPGLNATINNSGTIFSSGANTSGGSDGTSDGIDAGTRTGVVVNNASGGTISGARHGITADEDITVVNEAGGTIIGRNGSGVGSDGDATVTNRGTITGAYAGEGNIFNSSGVASTNGDGDGVDIDEIGTIENYGRIEGTGAGGVDSLGRTNGSEGIAMGGGTLNNYAGAVVIGANLGILVDDGARGSAVGATTITNAGTIQGQAGEAIVLIGNFDDSITNSGTITGVGAAIDFGAGNDTLTLQTGSSITGTVAGGDGTDTLALSGTGTLALGNYTGFEAASVAGGVWTLSGTGAFANGISIASGGTAAGTASLTGDVSNAGALQAGANGTGTVAITGNYAQASTGALNVSITAAGTNSSLTTSGTATLSGGALNITAGAGDYVAGTSYTVLNATGGLTGTFANVGQTGDLFSLPFLTTSVAYGANAVTLNVARSATSYATLAPANDLGRGVAQALNTAGPTASGSFLTVINELNRLSGTTATAALDSLAPDGVANAAATRGVNSGQAAGLAGARLAGLAGGSAAAAPAGGFTPLNRVAAGPAGWLQFGQSATSLDPTAGQGLPLDQLNLALGEQNGAVGDMGVWVRGYRLLGSGDAQAGLPSFDFNASGVVLGLDRQMSDKVVLGVLTGFASGANSNDDDSARTETDSMLFGIYGGYAFDSRTSLSGTLTYGLNDNDSRRSVTVGGVSGSSVASFDGQDLNATIDLARRYDLGTVTAVPSIGFELGRYNTDAYSETGTGAVSVDENTAWSYRPNVGVSLSRTLDLGNGRSLTPEARLRYAYELDGQAEATSARFVGSTAGSFNIAGRESDGSILSFGVGVSGKLTEAVNVFTSYDGDVRDDQSAHTVAVGLRFTW